MNEFIGREKEMSILESIYSKKGLGTLMVYGRRRIGKTTLLQEFIKDKKSAMIRSFESSFYENFVKMKRMVSEFIGRDISAEESVSNVFDELTTECSKGKCVVVFDELPYLLKGYPAFSSILQGFIDGCRDMDMMIVVCGSSISTLMSETREASKPLYQRFDHEMLVDDLPYRTCMQFHRDMSDLDALKVYMTVGGIPLYHRLMDCPTYEECLEKCFLGPTATLNTESQYIITSELSPSEHYTSIVACIAEGAVKQSKIASKLSLDKGTLSKRISKLVMLKVLDQVHPMIGAPSHPVYEIRDNLIAFQFEVLDRNIGIVDSIGLSTEEKIDLMRNDISTFLGHRFERLCMDYISSEYRSIDQGRWWGMVDTDDLDDNGSPIRTVEDIDIVNLMIDRNKRRVMMISECKFRRSPMTFQALNKLRIHWDASGEKGVPEIMLFSASGFEDNLVEYAEDNGIALIGLDILVGKEESPDMHGLRRTA